MAATSTACAALSRVATYQVLSAQHTFNLVISRGSVTDFYYPPNPKYSAIVNAANEGCLGGGGVDGAISSAGGYNLLADRQALPLLGPGIRCKTGSAVLTGPNSYDKLHTSFVIHAVGPNYTRYKLLDEGDGLLSSAYLDAMNRAEEAHLEAVAFSLLSAGIFRGSKTLKEVLTIGFDAIYNYDGYNELKEVHLCAFSMKESNTLLEIANDMGLKKIETGQCDIL